MVARVGWELWRQKNHPGLLDLSPASFFFCHSCLLDNIQYCMPNQAWGPCLIRLSSHFLGRTYPILVSERGRDLSTSMNSNNNKKYKKAQQPRFLLFSKMWALLQIHSSRHFLFIEGDPAFQSRAGFKKRLGLCHDSVWAILQTTTWKAVYLSHYQWGEQTG